MRESARARERGRERATERGGECVPVACAVLFGCAQYSSFVDNTSQNRFLKMVWFAGRGGDARFQLPVSYYEGQRAEGTWQGKVNSLSVEELRDLAEVARQGQLFIMHSLIGWQRADYSRCPNLVCVWLCACASECLCVSADALACPCLTCSRAVW